MSHLRTCNGTDHDNVLYTYQEKQFTGSFLPTNHIKGHRTKTILHSFVI